jgi:DcuC family C4-dicarboxylate transporter
MIWLAALVVVLAFSAVALRVEVRLVLLLAGAALGTLAGQPQKIIHAFFAGLVDASFVVPICCAMGFAHVLKETGCDAHLVRLLTEPLRRVRFVLIPGTVLVGFLVNVPIISQTSVALAVGTVLIPLLAAAGISPMVAGAALLLGASVGGELQNPGAPELSAILAELKKQATQPNLSASAALATWRPYVLLHLAVATFVFWGWAWWSHRTRNDMPTAPPQVGDTTEPVSLVKAVIPLLPIVLLVLAGPPLHWLTVDTAWLVPPGGDPHAFETRMIGAAMLVGTVAAALSDPRAGRHAAAVFFQGAGYAYTHIISLIVVAKCFGEGVKLTPLKEAFGDLLATMPALLLPAAVVLPMIFAYLCGSGIAATQTLYEVFVGPAMRLGVEPVALGGVVAIASAAGRTMSPVSAVALMSATLSGTSSFMLSRRVAGPLLAGLASVLTLAYVRLTP